MFSDAFSSFGIGGCLVFGDHTHGLFWQLAWDDLWAVKQFAMLKPGSVKINVAELVAALITHETFAGHLSGSLVHHYVDNSAVVAWVEKSRCPVRPFDRLCQRVALMRVALDVKVWSSWIPSKKNELADTASRARCKSIKVGSLILCKMPPRFVVTLGLT